MSLPTLNPIKKTAREIRRSIGRLEIYRLNNRTDENVLNGTVNSLIVALQNTQTLIPDELKDSQEV